MNRRGFLKALGAIAAGIALRPVPVLGEQYSELVPPAVYPSVDVPPPALDRTATFSRFWDDSDSVLLKPSAGKIYLYPDVSKTTSYFSGRAWVDLGSTGQTGQNSWRGDGEWKPSNGRA